MESKKFIAKYHLPGLFEFYDFYKVFLPIYRDHRDFFYDWCEIGSIYGAPADCLWGGGRVGYGDNDPVDVLALMNEFNISARLTFSNSLLENEHLSDNKCNKLCEMFAQMNGVQNGIIIHSDLLFSYLKKEYPSFIFVSSTTKVITDFKECVDEIMRDEFRYVVPDFRLNKFFDGWKTLDANLLDKVEFLCNECCAYECKDRKVCYENVSRMSLGMDCLEHICKSVGTASGYRFSRAMKNPSFIGIDDIINVYAPMGFSNFKIEGRSLGSAMILEFLLYYMVKPEYHIRVREDIYLDSMLDLF